MASRLPAALQTQKYEHSGAKLCRDSLFTTVENSFDPQAPTAQKSILKTKTANWSSGREMAKNEAKSQDDYSPHKNFK